MGKIELFETERACQANFDTASLALQDVPQRHSLYANKFFEFTNADVVVTWSPEDVLQYFPELSPPPGSGEEFGPTVTGLEVRYTLAIVSRYRTDLEPKGYGLGELLYAISLLPNEELILEVKTWETSQTQNDSSSDIEDKNSSDIKTTASDAKEIFDDYSSKERFEFSAHEEASFWVAKASADQKYSDETTEQHKTTAKAAHERISQSANQLSQKRSVKISSTRQVGSENKSTRKLKNINQSRTLNVNIFQVLRQYLLSTYLVDSRVVLLGQPYSPAAPIVGPGGTSVVPPASAGEMISSLRTYSLDPYGERFQSMILAHCVPRPELNPTLLHGARRYAFEVIPGPLADKDGDGVAEYPSGLQGLLDYLYGFYSPNSPPAEMKKIRVVQERTRPRARAKVLPTSIAVPRFHVLAGLARTQFTSTIERVKENVIAGWKETASALEHEWLIQREPLAVATYGTYAETMLGRCSGLEDYMEIQRQFDLEIKQKEIEKLKLEVEKMRLENQLLEQGKSLSSVTITNPPAQAALKVNVAAGTLPTAIQFGPEE